MVISEYINHLQNVNSHLHICRMTYRCILWLLCVLRKDGWCRGLPKNFNTIFYIKSWKIDIDIEYNQIWQHFAMTCRKWIQSEGVTSNVSLHYPHKKLFVTVILHLNKQCHVIKIYIPWCSILIVLALCNPLVLKRFNKRHIISQISSLWQTFILLLLFQKMSHGFTLCFTYFFFALMTHFPFLSIGMIRS